MDSLLSIKIGKNFLNLTLHEEDFGFPTELHYFCISHGKRACDVVGGTLKRFAACASLQRPSDKQITTPRELYDWTRDHLPNINTVYVTKKGYTEEEKMLALRFAKSTAVPGTQVSYSPAV